MANGGPETTLVSGSIYEVHIGNLSSKHRHPINLNHTRKYIKQSKKQ